MASAPESGLFVAPDQIPDVTKVVCTDQGGTAWTPDAMSALLAKGVKIGLATTEIRDSNPKSKKPVSIKPAVVLTNSKGVPIGPPKDAAAKPPKLDAVFNERGYSDHNPTFWATAEVRASFTDPESAMSSSRGAPENSSAQWYIDLESQKDVDPGCRFMHQFADAFLEGVKSGRIPAIEGFNNKKKFDANCKQKQDPEVVRADLSDPNSAPYCPIRGFDDNELSAAIKFKYYRRMNQRDQRDCTPAWVHAKSLEFATTNSMPEVAKFLKDNPGNPADKLFGGFKMRPVPAHYLNGTEYPLYQNGLKGHTCAMLLEMTTVTLPAGGMSIKFEPKKIIVLSGSRGMKRSAPEDFTALLASKGVKLTADAPAPADDDDAAVAAAAEAAEAADL